MEAYKIKRIYVVPFEIKKVQRENGKEAERFSRTLNDQFLLIWFNTKKAS